MMKPRVLTGALLGIGLLFSIGASAQDQVWLKDRRYTEGAGIRTGDLELHPGVAGEFGYDSNLLLRHEKESPVDAFRFRLTPSLSLSTLGPQRREGGVVSEPPKVSFDARVAATYNEYIPTKSANSDQFAQKRNVGILSSLRLDILPGRPWGGDVFGDFTRTIQPSTNPDTNFNRMTARAGAGLLWAPGGGLFDWRLGYQFTTTYFEDDALRNLGNNEHQVNTRGRWRFLPKTAWLYDASLGFMDYNTATASRLDSRPVRARVGLNGLVTQSFSFLVMAGWGSSFYRGAANAQQFDSLIGTAEVKWFLSPNPVSDPGGTAPSLSTLKLGFTRDFANSYLGDYYTNNRGYAGISYSFNGRFLVSLDGGLAGHSYPTVFYNARAQTHAPFTALYADASLFGEYRATDSIGINSTLRFTSNITDAGILGVPVGGVQSIDYLQWKRFEAFIGVRWFM
jgi:hypothetical protein